MAYEQKDGQGSLFPNDRKEKANRPDYTGTAKLDGKEYELAAWIKQGSKSQFLSLSIKPKGEQKQQREETPF